MKIVLALLALAFAQSAAAQWRVSSEQTVGGFKFPESAAYDARRKVLYVGNFGGEKLAPAEKDGLGYISKVGLNGKVMEERVFPAKDGEKMNKPKGIWIQGERLWVTDIDALWIFDLRTKKQRRLPVHDAKFLNDPALMGKALYVSDNRNDTVYKVEPADFLDAKVQPKVTTVFTGAGVNPNGLHPARSGMLYMVGFAGPNNPRFIGALGVSGQIKKLTEPFGGLDGVYELSDGSLLFTNWYNGTLSHWSETGGIQELAKGFKGPADFAVVPGGAGSMTVVVPDLPASQLRFVHLRR
jgi:sugar lactone lactonase YvrE